MDILTRFVQYEPIEKGWSGDKKYCVTDATGTKYLLRISPSVKKEAREFLFSMLEKVAELAIPMCTPIECGTCDDGVFMLLSWIDGEDLEVVMPRISEPEQYVLGLKSGEILRKLHSISPPEDENEFLPFQKSWSERFNRKVERNLKKYDECALKIPSGENYIQYIKQNRGLLENRPQCFQHGDFHAGNMMIEAGELKIIDFDRFDFGDPWEEFNRIVWSVAASPHFATGQIRGYFGGEPPQEFFMLLAFYISCNMLASIPWAIPFGQSEIDTMMKQSQDVLAWSDNMKNPVPTWYLDKYEVWDIYDINRNKTERFHERGKPLTDGDFHLVVHVWKYNSAGEWLIDKRTPRYENDDLGGKWETTGGAAVTGDDSLTAALREAKEELGIDLDPNDGELFLSLHPEPNVSEETLHGYGNFFIQQ